MTCRSCEKMVPRLYIFHGLRPRQSVWLAEKYFSLFDAAKVPAETVVRYQKISRKIFTKTEALPTFKFFCIPIKPSLTSELEIKLSRHVIYVEISVPPLLEYMQTMGTFPPRIGQNTELQRSHITYFSNHYGRSIAIMSAAGINAYSSVRHNQCGCTQRYALF